MRNREEVVEERGVGVGRERLVTVEREDREVVTAPVPIAGSEEALRRRSGTTPALGTRRRTANVSIPSNTITSNPNEPTDPGNHANNSNSSPTLTFSTLTNYLTYPFTLLTRTLPNIISRRPSDLDSTTSPTALLLHTPRDQLLACSSSPPSSTQNPFGTWKNNREYPSGSPTRSSSERRRAKEREEDERGGNRGWDWGWGGDVVRERPWDQPSSYGYW
jgi:hypothetical protein